MLFYLFIYFQDLVCELLVFRIVEVPDFKGGFHAETWSYFEHIGVILFHQDLRIKLFFSHRIRNSTNITPCTNTITNWPANWTSNS